MAQAVLELNLKTRLALNSRDLPASSSGIKKHAPPLPPTQLLELFNRAQSTTHLPTPKPRFHLLLGEQNFPLKG